MSETIRRRRWSWPTRVFGCLLATGIAAILGWIAVPNSIVSLDTQDTHARAAAAAVLAAAPWALNFASGAARRPVWSAFGLVWATYFSGIFALVICGVPYNQMALLVWGPIDGPGFFCSYLPWIATGSLLWAGGMLLLDSTRRRPSGPVDEQIRSARSQWLRAAAAALCIAILTVGIARLDVRHIGWTAPNPPETRRHAVTALISDGGSPGAGCHAGAVGGPRLLGYDGKCAVGDLYLYTDSIDGWRFHFGTSYWAPVACWQPSGSFDLTFAWDEGDSLTLWFSGKNYGLVLPKAPDYTTEIRPTYQGTMILYNDPTPCLDDAGRVVFLAMLGGG